MIKDGIATPARPHAPTYTVIQMGGFSTGLLSILRTNRNQSPYASSPPIAPSRATALPAPRVGATPELLALTPPAVPLADPPVVGEPPGPLPPEVLLDVLVIVVISDPEVDTMVVG